MVTMLRRLLCAASALACLLFMAAAPPPAPRRAVLVSWDGAKPAVLRTLLDRRRLPNLARLMREGRWSLEARTVVPSLTLPSHVSMLTGVSPRVHGVLWNDDRPEAGTVSVPTVFEVAKAAGLRTAMVYGKSKFRTLLKPGTLDAAELVGGDSSAVARAALRVLRDESPSLLLVHFAEPDAAGHGHGWGDAASGAPPSREYQAALVSADHALGRIVAALRADGGWPRTFLVVTADHGGHGKTHGSEDPQDMTIPWVAAGGLVLRQGKLAVPVSTLDTPRTALAALGLTAPATWEGKVIPCLVQAPVVTPLRRAA